MKTLVNVLGEHICIMNMGPMNVHYREVLL